MSRRSWYVLAVAVCAVAATVVGVVLLRPGTEPEPRGDQPRFKAYSLVKSGGIAGVMHHVEVSADGTVLYADDRPAAGRLPQPNIDRLSTLLSDPDLADEGHGGDSNCADAFRYTLTVGATRVSRDDCGEGETPVLDEIIELTAKDGLRPLRPADAPEFRGLTATYHLMSEEVRAKVRVDADGRTAVTRNGGRVRRDRLDTATLDALRLLYARPVGTPKSQSGVECAPEQIPRYKITPDGRTTVRVSLCGRLDDYRWKARLAIIQNLVRG